MLISTIIAGAGIAFRVLVYETMIRGLMIWGMEVLSDHTLHHATERVEDCLRGKVLRRDQIDKMLLSFDFLVGVNAWWRSRVGKVPSAESGKFLDLLPAGGRRVAGQVVNR